MSESENEQHSFSFVPLKNFVKLSQHNRTVSCIDMDKSGSRMVSGSHDYTMALYDFVGMDSSFSPFRFLRPVEGCPIRTTRFSPSGDLILVVAGGSPLLLDRNGASYMSYVRGDPYLKDMRNTSGHVSAVYDGVWDPANKGAFVTAGQDGTIRWWSERKKCDQTLVVRSGKGGRNPAVTKVRFLPDSSMVVCASDDGMLRVYSNKGPWIKPTQVLFLLFVD